MIILISYKAEYDIFVGKERITPWLIRGFSNKNTYITISPKVQQLKLISYKVSGVERIHRRIIGKKKKKISPNVQQRTKRRLLNGGERSRPARGPANKTRPKIGGHYRRVTKLGSVIARYDIAGRSHKSPLARCALLPSRRLIMRP